MFTSFRFGTCIENPKKEEKMTTFCFVIGAIFLLLASIFRVPKTYLGLADSLLSGRFKGEDEHGNSIPITLPYKEGLHLKFPWWKIELYKRETLSRPFEPRKYQSGSLNNDDEGTTVIVSGVMQYRLSDVALFRYAEVDESAIFSGLDAEIDNILAKSIAPLPFDKVVGMKAQLSEELTRHFNKPWTNAEGYERIVGGKRLTNSEVGYGIEVVKVNLNPIEMPEDIENERNKRKIENIQRQYQSTEWAHIQNMMSQMKKTFPEIKDGDLLEAVQIWQGQYTDRKHDSQRIKIDGIQELASIIRLMLERK